MIVEHRHYGKKSILPRPKSSSVVLGKWVRTGSARLVRLGDLNGAVVA
jgi:hypothetical protein